MTRTTDRRARRRRQAAAAALAGIAVVSLAGPVAAVAATPTTVPIAGTVPAWVHHVAPTHSRAAAVGVGPRQTVRVYLAPRGGIAALQADVTAMSTPGSASYGRFLTVSGFRAHYAPTASTAAAVTGYLRAQGLTGITTAPGRQYVRATGNRQQLDRAFGVQLRDYIHDGQHVVAPSTPALLPRPIGTQVATIVGLDTTVERARAMHVTDATSRAQAPSAIYPAATVNAKPCSQQYGKVLARYQGDYRTPLPAFGGTVLPYAPCGYTGTDFRGVYSPFTSLTGKGATVAVVDAYAAPRAAADARTYAANNGDAAYAAGQYTQVLPSSFSHQSDCDAPGWSVEQLLDIEAAHGMAPAANIRYYAAGSCSDDDLHDALARVVDENRADIVTNSWGGGESDSDVAEVRADELVFLQGAAQGMSFLFSSGDSGDTLRASGVKQVSYPASDPFVTAVGGTSTGIVRGESTPVPVLTTGWGSVGYQLAKDGRTWRSAGFQYGSGGGYSALFPRPAWQQKALADAPQAGRGVPDIALDADTSTGMLIGLTMQYPTSVHYGEFRVGGTSLASPLLAGYTALAVGDLHKRLGLLNPTFYRAGANQIVDVVPTKAKGLVRADFVNQHDATDGVAYTVRTFDQDSSLHTTNGWDPVTGLGYPDILLLEAIVGHDTRG